MCRFILFYLGSNPKLHCCHSKCLWIFSSLSLSLRFLFYVHFFSKCLDGFLCFVSSRCLALSLSFCVILPVYAYFYSILLLPLWQWQVSVVADFAIDAVCCCAIHCGIKPESRPGSTLTCFFFSVSLSSQ